MAYPSDNWTDKELEALEKRIAQVYKQAEKDLDKEVKEYFAKFKLRDKEMQARVEAGVMTKAEYQQWRLTQIGRGQRFEALRDKVAERYTEANEVANAYVNDATPSIYSLNRNYEAYNIEKTVGSCDFTMWDESTVRRLLVEQPDLMPYYPPSRALNRGIDLAYGKDQITKHVTSGIIRGLAPGKIANELMANLTGMNRASAVRAARTGITAAQNAGRMDSYVAAEKMGIQIRRRWICTKDSRTRFDHGMADGQIVVGTKKPFKVGGYKMMFPGDKSLGAPGHEIYNCRCTTRTVEKDGIEAEPRQMRVANPLWEEAKAEENKLSAKVDKLKEREQAETNPEKRKQLRKDRIAAQNDLKEATKKRQGLDKDVVVNEMTYPEWKKWKKGLENSDNGGIIKVVTQTAKALDQTEYGYYPEYSRLFSLTSTSIDEAVKTNPKFATGAFIYTHNCQRCVPAFEMRLRGYDVTAMPCKDEGTVDTLMRSPFNVWNFNAFDSDKSKRVQADREGNGKEKIVEFLTNAGDGARVEIVVDWQFGEYAHAFAAMNQNGTIVFVDPQNGKSGKTVEAYFDRVKNGETRWLRIDNLPLNENFRREVVRNPHEKND